MKDQIVRKMAFAGMEISVETDVGQQRHWHDPHSGESGSTTMLYPYGFIRRTDGEDGEEIDVYVGPDQAAPYAHVVHQMKKPEFSEYDEDKVMLGFGSAEAARAAYLAHYNDPRFFGDMTVMPVPHFRRVFVEGGKVAPAIPLPVQKEHEDPHTVACPLCGAEPGCNIDCPMCMKHGEDSIVIAGYPIGVVRDGTRLLDPGLFAAALDFARARGDAAGEAALLEVEKDVIASAPAGAPGMKLPSAGGYKMRRAAPVKDGKRAIEHLRKERSASVASPEVPGDKEELFLVDSEDERRVLGLVRVTKIWRPEDVPPLAAFEFAGGEPRCVVDVEVLELADEGDGSRATAIAVEKDQLGRPGQQKSRGPLSYVKPEGRLFFPVLDANVAQQTIMCVAIDPGKWDAHEHKIPEQIADAAMYEYMANYRIRTTRPSSMKATGIGAFHTVDAVPDVHIVEIFKVRGAPLVVNGKTVPVGAWVVVLWVLNEGYWKRILSGEINGVSIDGDAFGGPPTADQA
jgi:hypothetical protein